jgi:hypothetical protein
VTDRVQTLTVILANEMRTDDVEGVVHAIGMMKCVRAVTLGPVADAATYAAVFTATLEIREEILDVLNKRLK